MISFEWWNLIPIGLALISFVFNVVQYVEKKKLLKPFSNSLIGLFNDVKNKNILCYTKQNVILFHPNNPHKDLETLRWDFSDFLFFMIQALYGFQEHIVALLKSLEVSDKEVFKALDFGLNPHEKEMKEIWWKKYKEEQAKIPQKKAEEKKPKL